MATSMLRALLAESRLRETGLILRSFCAQAGRPLELIFVANRSDLAHALTTHGPDVALIDLTMLQPDVPARLTLLHGANSSVSPRDFGAFWTHSRTG
jgi:hypothetical protein